MASATTNERRGGHLRDPPRTSSTSSRRPPRCGWGSRWSAPAPTWYDPISQTEYYGLFDFFNGLRHGAGQRGRGGPPWPTCCLSGARGCGRRSSALAEQPRPRSGARCASGRVGGGASASPRTRGSPSRWVGPGIVSRPFHRSAGTPRDSRTPTARRWTRGPGPRGGGRARGRRAPELAPRAGPAGRGGLRAAVGPRRGVPDPHRPRADRPRREAVAGLGRRHPGWLDGVEVLRATRPRRRRSRPSISTSRRGTTGAAQDRQHGGRAGVYFAWPRRGGLTPTPRGAGGPPASESEPAPSARTLSAGASPWWAGSGRGARRSVRARVEGSAPG